MIKTLVQNKSIFAADDYAGEQFLIREALRRCESLNPVYFFGNGLELVTALESVVSRGRTEDLPCLILLDIKMPVMDGWEAMERIKGNLSLREIPIVLLTNSAASEDSKKGFQLGAARYITKPSSLAGLTEEMRALRDYWGALPEPVEGGFGSGADSFAGKARPAPKRASLFLNPRPDVTRKSVMVMDMEGVLDVHTVDIFEEALQGLFAQGRYKIVLNLGKLDYVSSAGFGILISVIREVRAKGGDIKISEAPRNVYNVFELLELPELFRIFKTEREAVQDFGT